MIHHHLALAQEFFPTEPNSVTPPSPPTPTPPMIIWYHNVQNHSLDSLQLALSSGLISHVMIMDMHRVDAPLNQAKDANDAVEWVHSAGKKAIWTRCLWPYSPVPSVRPRTLFDPNYYITEIKTLRQEAHTLHADYVGLDIEPYAHSDMRAPLKSDERWDHTLRQHLSDVIQQVIDRVGEVDFTLPGGSLRPDHPYNILARLGTYRISENTYYAHDKTIASIRYPFEIFGADVKTKRKLPGHNDLTYYLVPDVFDQSQRWSACRGVLLYTDKNAAEPVAQALHAYVATLRQRAAADQHTLTKEPKQP